MSKSQITKKKRIQAFIKKIPNAKLRKDMQTSLREYIKSEADEGYDLEPKTKNTIENFIIYFTSDDAERETLRKIK